MSAQTIRDEMKVLVACEESQAVTIELRKLGHETYSCDIIPCSGGHPEWHIMQDVVPMLNGNCGFDTVGGEEHNGYIDTRHYIDGKWDMIIAFPPCTDLAVSGARHFERKRADGTQQRSIDFFMKFANADCEKIAIENPVGIMSSKWRKPNQIINPFQFGDRFKKKTCLWLKGLPELISTDIVNPEEDFVYPNGKRYPQWMMDTLSKTSIERAKARSKTFPGIAKAMAKQWAVKEPIINQLPGQLSMFDL